MDLIHLHLFHQIVLQETFDVLQVVFFLKNRTCSFNRNKHMLPKTSCAIYNSNKKSSRESEYKIILGSIPKIIVYMVESKLFAKSSYVIQKLESTLPSSHS